ncbi:putative enoyl-CoA hydratase/isomerase YngF [Frankia canadensis]|uniref:Putative enoyl-CoA hydratase/isomerase YngF n=1 Tax=Frankia canadensis TaxID=1836972 RepID=A0A2I2KY69_9ACTN|nr:enoyl-CoA hydratase-related protein [Frankia canadensis]SNQ50599.1 putative enoyl-CoA hydratase/isomerase YngF [Frankia canadensis]SOU57889.1 putative enoyl-CoA hydratase/isomerase YngF [Frankia canadensis]
MTAQQVRPGGVTLERRGHVALVTLDRPQAHNALTVAMLARLAAIVREVNADDDLRVLVLTGAGSRAFSAGGDLGELIPRLTAGEVDVLIPDPTKRFFSDFYKPVVAAVNGLCLAGGLELLLGTDVRVASDRAVFGLPEVRWGLVPGAGTHVRLPQQISWPNAMQLLLTGETVDADEARRIGLIGEVVAPDKVLPRAIQLAETIAGNAPIAIRTAKEIAVRAWANEQRFGLESALNARVLASRDAREGPAAFIDKRTPRYENR